MTASDEAFRARVPLGRAGPLPGLLVAAATVLALLGGTVLVLLSPPVVHVGLDYAGSAARLGISSDEAYRLSDRAIRELLVGPARSRFRWARVCLASSTRRRLHTCATCESCCSACC